MSKKILSEIKRIRNYPIREVDYTKQKSISYSQFQLYCKCPHAWALQYRDGHKTYEPTIHTAFGTAFHETVQHWLTVVYEESAAQGDKLDLEEYLYQRMCEVYKSEKEKYDNQHFTTSTELNEFWEDGVEILRYLKKNRAMYFWKKGWHLVGIEIPLVLQPLKDYENVLYKGYLDLVLYHEPTGEYHIYDIKTSTRGWNEQAKKDEIKQYQLVLYKEYFSKLYDIPADKIFVKFLIVKRKIWEQSEFVQRRAQEFIPSSGPIKTKKAVGRLEMFIKSCFTSDGQYATTQHPKYPSDNNCKFCPFKDKPELCDRKS